MTALSAPSLSAPSLFAPGLAALRRCMGSRRSSSCCSARLLRRARRCRRGASRPLDQARIIKLPERAATLVIGDPLIADVSTAARRSRRHHRQGLWRHQCGRPRHSGAVLMERNVEVKGPPDRIVYVYRGVARNTYSCTPECAPRVSLGDDPISSTKPGASRPPQHPGACRRRGAALTAYGPSPTAAQSATLAGKLVADVSGP